MAVHVCKAWKTRKGTKMRKNAEVVAVGKNKRTHVTLKAERRQRAVLGATGMGDGE